MNVKSKVEYHNIFCRVISNTVVASIITNKLRFHRFVLDIDWLDLKMLESIVSVLPSDWFSLSGWPRFQ